jgi:hypothetical protein
MTLHAGDGFEAETEPAPSGFLIFSCILNSTSSELFRNGTSQAIGSAGAAGAGGLRLGSNCNLTSTLQMDLAEVLVYNALLISSERLSVENYLNSKYNLY